MIYFTKDMETGIPKIDEQHRELYERINAVLQAGVSAVTKAETERTLSFLNDYVIRHFNDEENLQRESGYPDAEPHKALHKSFVATIDRLRQDFALNGPSAKFTLAVNQSVIDWLVKHIQNVDMAFARYYKKTAR